MASTSASFSTASQRGRMPPPKYSRFMQQELPGARPFLTPLRAILLFYTIGTILISLGIVFLTASRRVVEIVSRYDDVCIPLAYQMKQVEFIQSEENKTCFLELQVPRGMKPPIYIYYQLDNFHQNHRRYVKSLSPRQLLDPKYENDTNSCEPHIKSNETVVPCGLVAWSLFNDTYLLSRNLHPLHINWTNISWRSDRKHKFGDKVYPKNFQRGSVRGGGELNESKPLSEQEELMVWMRLAALPSFRKMYGRIEEPLHQNDTIRISLQNNYNSYAFHGKKRIVLSTTTWLGGKNDTLGITSLVVGGIYIFFGLFFTVIQIVKPRKLGDPSQFSWNKNHTS